MIYSCRGNEAGKKGNSRVNRVSGVEVTAVRDKDIEKRHRTRKKQWTRLKCIF